MAEKINEALKTVIIFEINLFGFRIPVTDIVIVTWAIMVLLIVGSWLLTRRMKDVPGKGQNIAEMVVQFLNDLVKGLVGEQHYKAIVPYVGTVFLFLVFANTVSIFNILPANVFKIVPPTRNINVTLPLGIMSLLSVVFFGLTLDPKKYLRGFGKPMLIMLPFHVLDYFIRPVSLCFRLLGNIFGAMILMELIYALAAVGVPAVFSVYFDLFDGFLQAYIFSILTTIFIAEAIE